MEQTLLKKLLLQGQEKQRKTVQQTKSRNWMLYASLLLFAVLFTGFSAMASHFKGGQITYKHLGSGQYEMTIKGYWDKDAVGSIVLSYEGSPKINTGTTTVSKTMLPDGMTMEHVQRQRITWSKPGVYNISWRSCCRINGSNFGSEESGLFAAVNYNPEAPSSSPQFYDLPIFNFSIDNAISFNMNMEDPEGHEQEYSLELPYGLTGDPYELMKESGFSISNDGTINWERPLKGLWLVNVKLREKINGEFTGAFVLRDFILNVSASDNDAPVFTPVPEQFVTKGQTISFEVAAQDPQNQNVTLNANGSIFEKGATFAQTVSGANAKGNFSWATKAEDLGRYAVQFAATDSDIIPLSSQMTVYINVVERAEEACNVTVAYTVNSTPCTGSSNGKITLTASNGVAPYTYSLDGGKSFSSSAAFDKLASGTYTAIVKDAKGCASVPVQVQVAALTAPDVTLSLSATALCTNSVPLTLSGGSPTGGTYAGTGIENGIFNPAVAGVGKHTVTYTFMSSNGCTSVASKVITVSATSSTSLNMPMTRLCVNSATLKLTGGSPSGGIYSGTGIENGVFNPAVAGIGTHTVTYTYTNESGCSSTATQTIEVGVAPTVNAGADQTVVLGYGNNACATLTASGDATTYAYSWSNGATTQSISVCPGTTTVYTVTMTDKLGCTSSDQVTVFVKDVRCGNNNKKDKVIVCHKGKPICIAPQAVQAHLDHGDELGDCSSETTDAATATEGATVSVFPNPMVNESQLRVVAKEQGHVAVDILDMNGKVVLKLYNGMANAGQELNFNLKRSLGPSNIYIGRIITDKGVQTFKLMISE